MKKKDKTQQMLADIDAARLRNTELKAEHWELMIEVTRLRELAQGYRRTEITDGEMIVAIHEASQLVGNEAEVIVAPGEETQYMDVDKGHERGLGAVNEMNHEMTTQTIEGNVYRDRIPSLVSASSKETLEESEIRSRDFSEQNQGEEEFETEGEEKGREIVHVDQAMEE